jgi:hypothetical protein
MKHRLFNLMTALSLLLCVAVVAVWVRSRFHYDILTWRRCDERGKVVNPVVATTRGRVELIWRVVYHSSNPPSSRWLYNSTGRPGRGGFRDPDGVRASYDDVRWIRFQRQHPLPSNFYFSEYRLVLRLWYVALLAALLPAYWLYRKVQRRGLEEAGRCGDCGYDLRATPGRCPECGAEVAGAAVAVGGDA